MSMNLATPITADMTVETTLRLYPHTAQVFVAHSTACIGCWISGFHSIADVAALYHIELDDFLDELRIVVGKGQANANVNSLGD